jgi:hypothetical protein
MTLRSAFDPSFLAQIKQWIAAKGEVFVVIRYAYMAGSKDYLFVTSYEQFEQLIKTLPPMADVIVFRETQLPIRGIADDNLLNHALAEIQDGEYWFLLCRSGDRPGDFSSEGDNSHEALRSAFKEFSGKYIAVGIDPPFHEADNSSMQSGFIPMPDGTIKTGAY